MSVIKIPVGTYTIDEPVFIGCHVVRGVDDTEMTAKEFLATREAGLHVLVSRVRVAEGD